MSDSKLDNDEIHYMDEISDEISLPLSPKVVEENIVPHSAFLLDASNPYTTNRSSNTEVNSNLETEAANGFPGMHNALLPNGEVDMGVGLETMIGPAIQTPDVNVYQHKKTLAQGMMDLALLSANANQLRYVLQTNGLHPYYYVSLAMISTSLLLQIAVGIGLIWNSRYDVKEDDQMHKADQANNWTVIGIFLVTILNVFISSFGVADQVESTTS